MKLTCLMIFQTALSLLYHLFCRDSEVHRKNRILLTVNPPGLVRPDTMETICTESVDHIAGCNLPAICIIYFYRQFIHALSPNNPNMLSNPR